MKEYAPNHYEKAFGNWLVENQVEFVSTADQHAPVFGQSHMKSFDFLLCPSKGKKIIAEVKGRHFKGANLEGLSHLECWVTTEDVDGLAAWQKTLGTEYDATFIFAYKVQNIDVDFDGREIFEFGDDRYFFFDLRKSGRGLRVFARRVERRGLFYKYFVSQDHLPGRYVEVKDRKTIQGIYDRYAKEKDIFSD